MLTSVQKQKNRIKLAAAQVLYGKIPVKYNKYDVTVITVRVK